MLFFVIYDV